MGKKANLRDAREARSKAIAREPASEPVVGNGLVGATPPPGDGNVLQFNVDQLFAAYGAKEFENQLLKAEIQKRDQVIATYKNLLFNAQYGDGTAKAAAGGGPGPGEPSV